MFFFLIKQIFSEWIIHLNEERWLVTQKNIMAKIIIIEKK
jgi:hypothetical protein